MLYKKDGRHERSPKVKPRLERHLVVPSSIGHETLSYFRLDLGQKKNKKQIKPQINFFSQR